MKLNLLILLMFLPSVLMAQTPDRRVYAPVTALSLNPAAIADDQAYRVDLAFQYGTTVMDTPMNMGSLTGLFRVWKALHFGAKIQAGYNSWGWGIGARTGLGLNLGRTWYIGVLGSFYRMHDKNGIFHVNSLDAGVRAVPSPFLSFGLSANNIVRNGHQVPRWLRAGLGIRPWEDQRLTIGVEAASTWDASEVSSVLHAGIRLYRGLVLNLGFNVQYRPGLDFGGMAGLNLYFGKVNARTAGGWSAKQGAATWAAGIDITAPKPFDHRLITPSWLVYDIQGLSMSCSGPLSIDCSLLNTLKDLFIISRMKGVKGLIIRTGTCPSGMGDASLIAMMIRRIQRKGIKVVVGMGMCGPKGFAAFGGADRLYLIPGTASAIVPGAHRLVFIHKLLKNIGVSVDYEATGAFKTYPLMFTRDTPTGPQTRMVTDLINERCNMYTHALNRARHTKLRCHAGAPAIYSAARAVRMGLADGVRHLDRLVEDIAKQADASPQRFYQTKDHQWHGLPSIAVIPVHGDIIAGTSLDIPALGIHMSGSATVSKLIERAADSDDVAGILLFVDSPGGDLAASEAIYHAISGAKRRKPIAVVFGNTAASGGYYLSTGASRIFTSPQTVTGSIGVFLLRFSILDLLAKLGITTFAVPKGRDVDAFSLLADHRNVNKQDMEHLLADAFDLFISRIRKNRGKKTADWAKKAGALVITGKRAVQLGLADAQGGFGDAVDYLTKQAGSPDCSIKVLTPPSLAQRLNSALNPFARSLLKGLGNAVEAVLAVSMTKTVSIRLPYVIMSP